MLILVVDDEELVRDPICDFLRSLGHEVVGAENGPRALLVAKDVGTNIEFVLSDIHMPGMNGPEMWGQMKNLVSPRCSVLFMSGGAGLLRSGCELPGEILIKPFSLQVLQEKLSAHDRPSS